MSRFFPYDEPSVAQILILMSFLYFLNVAGYIGDRLCYAGLVLQIFVGVIYGTPLAAILLHSWEETFLLLGYIGLILIVFEGGLDTNVALLRKNLILSTLCAAIGIILPIGFSLLLLHLAFGYTLVEAFVAGAALSSTSIGTTLSILSSTTGGIGDQSSLKKKFHETRIGTVLISAAIIDDVIGLVMSSVIASLGRADVSGSNNLGWTIGRPILAAVGMAFLTPLIAYFIVSPAYHRWLEPKLIEHKYKHKISLFLMILGLCAAIAIAYYAGTSVLFGAYLAGTLFAYIQNDKDEEHPFAESFESQVKKLLHILLAPLFFASIGFAIPFLGLWRGSIIWKGLLYTLLMILGKLLVGCVIPLWTLAEMWFEKRKKPQEPPVELETTPSSPVQIPKALSSLPATALLGLALVARGEIGLLIIQIGFNGARHILSEDLFLIAIWAILLCTVLSPICVGIIVRKYDEIIRNGRWG